MRYRNKKETRLIIYKGTIHLDDAFGRYRICNMHLHGAFGRYNWMKHFHDTFRRYIWTTQTIQTIRTIQTKETICLTMHLHDTFAR